ncbi:hypothetical protein F2Q69_00013675 [Brassica cretica]|uniref:Uncharacterized protein n=1 Tax=Brassica cretica TaxID=69181 RepID=A0A8S9QNR6_BRACR|nr:hypothetical protein F2Q69_00013675 [Brassica cretica]
MNFGWRTGWIEGSHKGCGKPPIFQTPMVLDMTHKTTKLRAVGISTCAGRSVRAAGRFDRKICVPAWPKSSESLRILALEKYPKEKSIIGSSKEARSTVRWPVHATSSGMASSVVWSWFQLKFHYGRTRIDPVHGSVSLSGTVGRVDLG